LPARILVVDNDPWIQRTVAAALGRWGHLVTLAGDGQGALASALRTTPELVITAVTLPAVDGWCWWEQLRARPELAATPVLFLTQSQATGVRGFEPSRDERLTKPFRVEELERTISVLLSRATPASGNVRVPWVTRGADVEKASAGYRPLSAMRGDLDQIALSSVLIVLEMERKSGILLLERDAGTARLYLRKGRIIRADIDPDRHTAGAAAVYEALTWADGTFDFLVGDVGGVDEIQTSTTYLLMEGARRLDEARHDKSTA